MSRPSLDLVEVVHFAGGRNVGSLPIYRLHDHTGDDLGRLEHLAPNVQPGDVVVLEALVTGRVESQPGAPIAALLEVVIAPTYHPADDALP